jgi:glycosyltransferase involved in cell wall biosynthesis
MAEEVAIISGYAASLHLFRGNLIREIVRRGHSVRAYAPEPEPPAAVRELPLTYEPWPVRRGGTNPVTDAHALAYLTRSLRRHRPAAVLSYTIKPVIYGSLAAAAAGVPKIHAMVTGLGYAFGQQGGLRQRIVSRLVPAMYRTAIGRCQGLFLQNHDDERDLRAAGALPPQVPITFIPGSGIDLQRFAPTDPPRGPMSFLYIGRLLTEKGIGEFVEAARTIKAEYPEARFVVVGDLDPNPTSVTRDELDRWVSDELIEYRGHVDDVRPEIEACSVLVLPSYREGTPRSVLEAMAMARPVITTDAPGCRETVEHGETGFLVPVRDADAVAAAMERFLVAPDQIAPMGEAGRRLAESKFDDRIVNETICNTMEL